MLTVRQYRMLHALRESVMTPDRFNRSGLALDTKIPGPIIDAVLEILSDHETAHHPTTEMKDTTPC